MYLDRELLNCINYINLLKFFLGYIKFFHQYPYLHIFLKGDTLIVL